MKKKNKVEKLVKNVFNKEAGVLANIFGVVAALWITPIVVGFLIIQSFVWGVEFIIKKVKSWI
tara:strand:- start:19531 stop:19719 length:189 start_codon:yes stop_codon:yes gene_type:complete